MLEVIFIFNYSFVTGTIDYITGIMVMLATTVVVLNNIGAASSFDAHTCHNVSLPAHLCQVMYISRVLYSIFALFWNLLLAILLLSVCRTHTIGTRGCDVIVLNGALEK